MLSRSIVGPHPYDPTVTQAAIDAAVLAGDSVATTIIRRSIAALAPLGTHVVLRGEPGTGRRTCAELLHRDGPRHDDPFVSLALGRATAAAIGAHLFGAGGAAGLGAQARGLTLYLDGIEHLALEDQARFAETLADGGGLGIRVFAATTRSLETEVRCGRFSRVLFERIGLLQISVPALRDRTSDIAPIAQHALAVWNAGHRGLPRRFGSGALAALEAHSWPGNVRELVELVHRACAGTRARTITPERLRCLLGRRPRRTAAPDVAPLREVECDYIQSVLARCNGNQSLAARRLGIGRGTLARRLRECERYARRAAS